MTATIESYFISQKVRIQVEVIQNNVLTDPIEITIMNRDPSGNEASQVYNSGAGNVVKVATGLYYYDLTLDEEGNWYIRVETTGVVAAYELWIICTESYFDSP